MENTQTILETILKKQEDLKKLSDKEIEVLVKKYIREEELPKKREIAERIILEHSLSVEELNVYSIYLKSIYEEELRKSSADLDRYLNIAEEIETLYNKRVDTKRRIIRIENLIKDIELTIIKISSIRAKIVHGHAVRKDQEYRKAFIYDGMERAKYQEQVEDFNNKGFLHRRLNRKKMIKLQSEYEQEEQINTSNIDLKEQEYRECESEYFGEIRKIFDTAMQNKEVREAFISTTKYLYKKDLKTSKDEYDMIIIPKEISESFTNDMLYYYFLEYIGRVRIEDFSVEFFIEKLTEYTTLYLKNFVGKLTYQKERMVQQIHELIRSGKETIKTTKIEEEAVLEEQQIISKKIVVKQ